MVESGTQTGEGQTGEDIVKTITTGEYQPAEEPAKKIEMKSTGSQTTEEYQYLLDSRKLEIGTKSIINNYITAAKVVNITFLIYLFCFTVFFWTLSGLEELGWSNNKHDKYYGWYLCGWIFGGICFITAVIAVVYFGWYRGYTQEDVENSLNLIDSMSNLYSGSLAPKDLATSMSSILAPSGASVYQKDFIRKHYRQFENRVAMYLKSMRNHVA